MKARTWILSLVAALCWIAVPASASGLGDIRVNARFLTDRMAFELNLNSMQYNDLFEINYDFLYNIDPYVDRLAYSDPYALDCYYRYLDERNDDLRWVLSSLAYTRFMAIEYFFRPIYALNNICYLRIYQKYPNHDFFYFARPVHYLTYRGAHSRVHCGGVSFYRANYKKHYHHPVYNGHFRSRPDFRKHDFKPGAPHKGGNGFHFTPVRDPRPGSSAVRPGNGRPGGNNPRPGTGDKHPGMNAPRPGNEGSRPADRGNRPSYNRPSSTQNRSEHRNPIRPSSNKRGEKGSVNRPSRSERSTRPSARPGQKSNQKDNRRDNRQSGRAFLHNM